jgi:hypothetical protein
MRPSLQSNGAGEQERYQRLIDLASAEVWGSSM